jgi:hypothetical protein
MLPAGPSVTNADEAKLLSLIHRASRRLLLLAPGLTAPVAAAIGQAWQRLGAAAVTVILDVDAEVCRLGYGTIEGLDRVQRTAAQFQTLICHQKGVRIGLLISDDTTLIFSPTPLLVEAGSERADQPNAIELAALPKEIACDVGLGAETERKVGLDPLPALDVIAADLQSNPPVKFDLARKVRVFNSRFQFVELEMSGCYLSQKKVPIPSDLMGLAQDEKARERLHASFDLIGKADLVVKVSERKTLSEDSLRKTKAAIIKKFLTSLTGYGAVVLRANKEKLQVAVNDLQADITAFQSEVKTQLQKHINTNRDAVVAALMPGVLKNPPDHFTKIHGPKPPEAALRKWLADEIALAFGAAEDVTGEMKLSLVFKDVAYESLIDPRFLEIARNAMPGLGFLHEEYDAAKESEDDDEDDGAAPPLKR